MYRNLNQDHLGIMYTPKDGNSVKLIEASRWPVIADNGAFAGFDPAYFRRMLTKLAPYRERVLFVTAPDVVGDAQATRALYNEWRDELQEWPVAYVAQDGVTSIPWDDIAALFIGGSTEFKLGPVAARATGEAKRRGKWVHMGRVNSASRIRYAASLDVDSIDGSGYSMFPDTNIPKALSVITGLSGGLFSILPASCWEVS